MGRLSHYFWTRLAQLGNWLFLKALVHLSQEEAGKYIKVLVPDRYARPQVRRRY